MMYDNIHIDFVSMIEPYLYQSYILSSEDSEYTFYYIFIRIFALTLICMRLSYCSYEFAIIRYPIRLIVLSHQSLRDICVHNRLFLFLFKVIYCSPMLVGAERVLYAQLYRWRNRCVFVIINISFLWREREKVVSFFFEIHCHSLIKDSTNNHICSIVSINLDMVE